MILDARQKKASPRALTGRILALIGGIFFVLGALLGGAALLVRLATAFQLWLVFGLLSLIFASLGLVLLVVGLLLRLLPGDSPSGNVVHYFYAALANQDYKTAFQYLALGTGAFPGQRLNPEMFIESFIQGAQAADAAQGRVTNHTLTGVQAQPTYRYFTLRVTRESGSYKTRLQLRQQGGEWKIVSFDRF